MADVRALLKAKRQEARISHPLASYNQSGQLRCLACGPVKHAAAWQGHLGSKLHRTTVARLKEQDRLREAEQEQEDEQQQFHAPNSKRKAEEHGSDDESDTESKRRKVDPSSAFPSDFFSNSDSSRAPLPPQSDDEDDVPSSVMQPAPAPVQATSLDSEWERFQRDVVNAPDHRDAYENATIMAEPELASETPEGFPPQQENEEVAEQPNKLDLEEARRQKEQDERELIMDRLLDEERAQEEADMKVTVMKNRLDALLRKRNAAKAAKLKPTA
jgi:zinc finger protein 830